MEVFVEKEVSKRALLLASKVLVIATVNPKKRPSMSYDRFENYFKLKAGATVADALKAGVRMDDIRHDSAHGFIAVGDKDIAAAAKRKEREKAAAVKAAKELLGITE